MRVLDEARRGPMVPFSFKAPLRSSFYLEIALQEISLMAQGAKAEGEGVIKRDFTRTATHPAGDPGQNKQSFPITLASDCFCTEEKPSNVLFVWMFEEA